MSIPRFSIFLSLAASLFAAACETAPSAAAPAVLASDDAETMDAVKRVIASAMGRARIELGPSDPTQTPTLSVLPPPPGPYEDRSLARPAHFDIMIKDGACYLLWRETGETYALKDVACRALAD